MYIKMEKRALNRLQKISGIGPKLAQQLYNNGIRTKADLRRYATKCDLPIATMTDLKYNPIGKIPHEFIVELEKYIKAAFKGIKVAITGSYRRKKQVSHDIDVMINRDQLPKNITSADISPELIKRLKRQETKLGKRFGFTTCMIPSYAAGKDKLSTLWTFKWVHGTSPWPRLDGKYVKVDVFITTAEEWPFTLLYTTGSSKFNIRMRAVAKNKKLKLNRHGIERVVAQGIIEKIPAQSELDIFRILGRPWVPPQKRIK